MIVLSRAKGDVLTIGPLEDGSVINVIVVDISAGRVRIGVEAPQGYSILKEEAWSKLQHKRLQGENAPDAT